MTKEDSPVKFYLASQDKPQTPAADPGLQARLDAVTKERDALQTKLDKVKAIPDNALELLESVKGIGPDTAQKALDVLTTGQPSDGK